MRSTGLICYVRCLLNDVIVAMLGSNCLILETVALIPSGRPSLSFNIFLSSGILIFLNNVSYFLFSKLLKNTGRWNGAFAYSTYMVKKYGSESVHLQ
jgi:hypothetical protein